jgi:NADH-quinone oxidoreductase subunit N
MTPNIEYYRWVIDSNSWIMLWPEMGMALLGVIVLALDLIFSRFNTMSLVRMSSWIQLGMLGLLGVTHMLLAHLLPNYSLEGLHLFNNSIYIDGNADLQRGFILLSSFFVTRLAAVYLERRHLPSAEYLHFIVITAAALMIWVISRNFLLFFVALETAAIGFYLMSAFDNRSALSQEAGLKYLIMGGLSSAVMLMGIVLLYGACSDPALQMSSDEPFVFQQIQRFIQSNSDHVWVVAGSLMVMIGLIFKIGAVPFQFWVPDVYQGAPTPTMAFLGVGSKAAAAFVLLTLIKGPFASLGYLYVPLLSAVTLMTVLVGNLAALGQRNVKRLMGLSGVSHAGFLLMGILAVSKGVTWAEPVLYFYLAMYALSSFAITGVMVCVAPDEDALQSMDDYRGLYARNPFLAWVLGIGLGSLAGIPPLGGFIAKFLMLKAGFQADLQLIVVVSLIGVIISIGYYFAWIRVCFFKPEATELSKPAPAVPIQSISFSHRLLLGIISLVTLVCGIYQGGFWVLVR